MKMIGLRLIRKEKKYNQLKVAMDLSISREALSYYENGKRGIPLELMDAWLRILRIEIRLQTRGNTPAKPQEEIRNDLEVFRFLKCRRNYLIPEMRSLLAQKLMQESVRSEIQSQQTPISLHFDWRQR